MAVLLLGLNSQVVPVGGSVLEAVEVELLLDDSAFCEMPEAVAVGVVVELCSR